MNAKKLLSTLLSAAMAVSMLAGCFGGGGNKNYSDKAADAANAVQSTVVFATDAKLSKSLQDALENFTQLDDIKDAMEADENLKSLLTSGYDLDVVAEQGEDAEAAAKAIAEKYIVSIVSGKKAEGKIAMVLHDGNGYYYVAVLTYGSGGSGSGGGAGGGSDSGDDGNHPGDDDDEEENGCVFLKGITVTPPSTLVYVVGQEFKPEDMTIMAFYSDGSSKDVTLDSKWECSLWNAAKVFTTAGDSQVVVTYEGKKAAFSITVVPVTLTGIQVSGNYSTEYYEGEFFDYQNLVVEACYNNGDVKVVTDYKLSCGGFDGEGKLKPGKYNVVVEYEGFTAEIPISVTSIVIEWLKTEITSTGEYSYGGTFQKSSLTVKAVYSDVTEEVKDFDVTSIALNDKNQFVASGNVTLAITYKDKYGDEHTEQVEIYVQPVEPTATGDLNVTWNSEKTYKVGESVDKDDLKVEIVYSDVFGNLIYVETKDFDITSNPFKVDGDAVPVTVEVKLDGDTLKGQTSAKVEKADPVVTGIHAEPDNIICYVGQTFKKSALTVYADYSDGDSLKLDSEDYTITDISEGVLTEAKTYNVTIKYNVDSSMTDVVTVIVKQPTVEKIELIVPEDEKFDIGDSLFWDNKLLVSTFREGFQIKITYKESGIEPKYVEIEQSMLSGKIKATYEGVFGGTNDLGFVKAGNQDVQVKYYDTDSLKWYTTTVNVNVTVTGGRD